MVSLVCSSCSWFVLAPKVLQLCINHFVLVLCRSMGVSEGCHFFLVPSQSSKMPLYPSIVLRARECAPTPCPSAIFSLGLTFEPLMELGVRHFGFVFKVFASIRFLYPYWGHYGFGCSTGIPFFHIFFTLGCFG